MDVRHGSYIVGDGHLRMIGGRPAVGAASLEVVIDVAWTKWSHDRRIVSGSLFLSSQQGQELAELTMRGRFIDAVLGRTDCLAFKGLISYQALEEIERLRAGKDLALKTQYQLLTDDGCSTKEGLQVFPNKGDRLLEGWDGDASINIAAATWLGILENVGYRSGLILELTYPLGRDNEKSLVRYIKKARDAFDGGRYDDCVAQIRHILEGIDERRGDANAASVAVGKYRGSPEARRAMTFSERLLAVRKSLEHVSHAPHHKGDDVIARAEAKAMLAMTAAMLELFPEPSV